MPCADNELGLGAIVGIGVMNLSSRRKNPVLGLLRSVLMDLHDSAQYADGIHDRELQLETSLADE